MTITPRLNQIDHKLFEGTVFETSLFPPLSLTHVSNKWIWKYSQLEWTPPKIWAHFLSPMWSTCFQNLIFKTWSFDKKLGTLALDLTYKLKLPALSKWGIGRRQRLCCDLWISECLALRERRWLFQAGRELSSSESHRGGNELALTNQSCPNSSFCRWRNWTPGRLSCPRSLS